MPLVVVAHSAFKSGDSWNHIQSKYRSWWLENAESLSLYGGRGEGRHNTPPSLSCSPGTKF